MAKKDSSAIPEASKEKSIELISDGRLKHMAFIMDGNGRWAERRGMPRRFGHPYGAKRIDEITAYCRDIGIQAVTLYAFSTENWQRPEAEVKQILKLLGDYLKDCEKIAERDNIWVRVLGDISPFSPEFQKTITDLEEHTKGRKNLLNIALNYGGRAEIAHAFNELIKQGKTEVTEADISGAVYTAGVPDPDIIVRTGGDLRTSNFLMWQSAYSELYFTDTLWPDMTPHDVDLAVVEFYRRKRRFGKVE